MKAFTIVAACLFLLTGCSTITTYNQSLKDYEGDDRVGIAFGMTFTSTFSKFDRQVRVYPETLRCIDLYSERNGFVSGNLYGDSVPDNKFIGVPEVEGMSKNRAEFWVSAKDNISIRTIYTGFVKQEGSFPNISKVSESLVSFKPEAGAFYYVMVDMEKVDPITLKYLRVYKITEDAEGKLTLKHVDNIPQINNCPGQQPWFTKMAAVI
ncbi:Uncharacterised protein [Leminorella richardii]|uniref:Lipoprotein n=1 Tax=Leminorella richardii TaxID=158841 RepID=A0A2X4USB0_9GAMM|nr:hypothetical protein [Leminorella richardii]SQI38568.1 Uncharacterised protein [Leminorella richardii]